MIELELPLEFSEVYPRTDHFVTGWGGDRPIWLTNAYLENSTILSLEIPLLAVHDNEELVEVGSPVIIYRVVDTVESVNGIISYCTPVSGTLSISEWKKVHEEGGSLQSIGVMGKNPVDSNYQMLIDRRDTEIQLSENSSKLRLNSVLSDSVTNEGKDPF